jgi:hypothetical protein
VDILVSFSRLLQVVAETIKAVPNAKVK